MFEGDSHCDVPLQAMFLRTCRYYGISHPIVQGYYEEILRCFQFKIPSKKFPYPKEIQTINTDVIRLFKNIGGNISRESRIISTVLIVDHLKSYLSREAILSLKRLCSTETQVGSYLLRLV